MKIKIGDRIKFCTPVNGLYEPMAVDTIWSVVTGILVNGNPLVQYDGQDNFIVRRDEVVAVDPS